ncbi:NAD(P)-dependent oxidoreductase [Eikenella corrodens]|uniref:NAD(P)-dependent oxidoreductase n=1 Tax=Eikenella corrodens TaxID=539 RepID=UPI00129BBBCE|nr:NAD(P)-binding oxidoreductase [Eikenella corrodens]
MLIIFGANGPSGRQLIQQLSPLERETTVAALRLPEQQSDDFFANQHIRTTVVDTLDAEAVAQAVQQYRPNTVVSFVGGKNEQGIRSDATGNLHIIRALEQNAPQARFILVTSMGCGEQYPLMSDMFKQALGEAVAAKTEAENALRQSPLAWTILRPCGLANGDDTAYQLHEQLPAIPRQYMTRTALAAAVRQIIGEDGHEGKAYSVTSGEAA